VEFFEMDSSDWSRERYSIPHPTLSLNSVSDLVSKIWYRIPFDQSDPSITKIPPTDPLNLRPGRDP
jgi:hypothetical protein